MTPEQTRAYNRAKTQRRRAAEGLGLTHVRLWVEPDDVSLVGMVKDRTEAMIDEALARKHGGGE